MKSYYLKTIACFYICTLSTALSNCYKTDYHKSDVIEIVNDMPCGPKIGGKCLNNTRTVIKIPITGVDSSSSGLSSFSNTQVGVTRTTETQVCQQQNDGTCAWVTTNSKSDKVMSFGQIASGNICPCP
jgi:hypothetical protein